MIIIEEKNGGAALNVKEGTKNETIVLAIEMLIEVVMENLPVEIDELLADLKEVYLRDLSEKKENE